MSHELELNEAGEARMMYAGGAPWHRLGKHIETECTCEEALKYAQLDWTVRVEPVYLGGPEANTFLHEQGLEELNGIHLRGKKLPNINAVVRCDGMEVKALGTVGSQYEVIQNHEAMEFLDQMVGEGLAMYHTAGSLFGGRRGFCACKLPDSIHVGPDQIDKYLVAMWGHDGTMSYHIKWTPIRVVCWNTASAAFGASRSGQVQEKDCVSIRHTKGWKTNLDEARRILQLGNVYYDRVGECFNKLLAIPMSAPEFTTFSEVLYPNKPKDEADGGGEVDRSLVRMKLLTNFEYGIGNEHPDVKHTRWAAWNAVTQYTDHDKQLSKTAEYPGSRRMDNIVWGSGAAIKNKALGMLV